MIQSSTAGIAGFWILDSGFWIRRNMCDSESCDLESSILAAVQNPKSKIQNREVLLYCRGTMSGPLEQPYLELMRHVLDHGLAKNDRTGTGTLSTFGHQMRFDLRRGFPLLTTKRLHLRSIIYELLWFLRGETNVEYLRDNGVTIWDEWADANGELGPVYGAQWRAWQSADGRSIDQIAQLIEQIRNTPDSRRLIISAWNVGELDRMALPPCHAFMQFYVINGTLSCQLYQRSADIFIGVPFNIASYALLLMMIAQVCELEAGELVHTLGDAHLYLNHLDQARTQLERTPYPAPRMSLNPRVTSIFEFDFSDFELSGYEAHPHIKAQVAV